MARARRASTRATRRSAREWALRGILASIFLVFGYVAVAQSLGSAQKDAFPARAYALAPWDGRIGAQWSARLSDGNASPADRVVADRLATEALRRDATAVPAVSTLGIDAQIRGDTAAARRLFVYADRLSRRDLRTRLWAIEDAVARGDIPGALRQYDIALRTSKLASDLLFPVLAPASEQPAVARELVRTLTRHPPWSEGFLAYLASTADRPEAMARLFIGLHRNGVVASDRVGATAIERLIAGGHDDAAWALYATIRPGSQRDHSRDPTFSRYIDVPTLFDWSLSNDDSGLSASIGRNGTRGIVDFAAPASIGGVLLQQRQLLPQGRYVIEGRSAGVEQVQAARPYWTLACANGRELGRVDVTNSSVSNGRFAGIVTVPAGGCRAQILRLIARPSDDVSGVSGQLLGVTLRPAA